MHIKKNKYFNWYTNIIEKRLKDIPINEYYEKHHILPKSLGGKLSKHNIVIVTGREHYILHKLLTKFIADEKGRYSMYFAFMYMNMKSKFTGGRYNNSKLFEQFRIEYSKKLKEYMLLYSPFKDKEIHQKSMRTRKLNSSNIFQTNNPMFNDISKNKKILKTSGIYHYYRRINKYFYSIDNGKNWIEIKIENTLKESLNNLGFPLGTFNRMINSNYTPKRGPLTGYKIKKINENKEN